jgi:lathosterol oxidase
MTGWPILFSTLAMTLIVGVRYLITSGASSPGQQTPEAPGPLRRARPQMRREIGWSLAQCGDLRRSGGRRCLGMAEPRLDADLHRHSCASSLVSAGLGPAVPLGTTRGSTGRTAGCTGRAVSRRACGAPCQPPADGLGGDELSSVEAVTGAVVIPALAFIDSRSMSPCSASVLTIMTVMGVTNHMGWEIFPRRMVHGPVRGTG